MTFLRTKGFGILLFAAAAPLSLTACDGQQEDTAYEADAADVSGGELIVTDESSPGVPVDVPDTPMTNVPPETVPPETVPPETVPPETPEVGQASPTP